MKKNTLILFAIFISGVLASQPALKSVLYDFDGLDIGQTDLPDGDYSNFDLQYSVVQKPIAGGEMLGDRVLRMEVNWSLGKGEFGKGITKYIELSRASD